MRDVAILSYAQTPYKAQEKDRNERHQAASDHRDAAILSAALGFQ